MRLVICRSFVNLITFLIFEILLTFHFFCFHIGNPIGIPSNADQTKLKADRLHVKMYAANGLIVSRWLMSSQFIRTIVSTNLYMCHIRFIIYTCYKHRNESNKTPGQCSSNGRSYRAIITEKVIHSSTRRACHHHYYHWWIKGLNQHLDLLHGRKLTLQSQSCTFCTENQVFCRTQDPRLSKK